jgi:hypothetical protein
VTVEQVGMLLEHTVGNLDPLYIVSLVPDGLEIPRYVTIKIYFVEISLSHPDTLLAYHE